MRLANPAFERSIRRQAKKEMRRDKPLWKDYKRHKARTWRITDRNVGLGWFYLVATAAVGQAAKADYPAILIGFTLYATSAALFRTHQFIGAVFTGPDRQVLFNLPLSDEDYLKYASRKYFKSWWSAFCVYAAVCATLSYRDDLPEWKVAIVSLLAAVLLTACGLGLGLWQVVFAPGSVGLRSYAPFVLPIAGCFFLTPHQAQQLWPVLLATPAGWVSHAFAASMGIDPPSGIWWAVTAAGFSASIPFAWRILRPRMLEGLEGQTVAVAAWPDDRVDTELEIQLVDASQPVDEHLGWLEKLVVRFYSPRERVVFDFLVGCGTPSWSKFWKPAAIIAAVAGALAIPSLGLPPWIHPVLFFGVVAFSVPVLGGSWVGFTRAGYAGLFLPVYAGLPVGFDEICLVILKANLVRIALWLPVGLLLSILGGNFPLFIYTALILLAIQPVSVVAKFSQTTNDSKRRGLRVMLHLAALLALGGAGFAAFIALLASSWRFTAGGVMMIVSGLILLVYRSLFLGRGIDLLSSPS